MPLIATNQRRPNAPVEMGPNRERVYFFKPSNPADPGSVHVADVSDEDFDLLIKIEGYFTFRGTIAAAAPRPAPVAPAEPPAATTTAGAATSTAGEPAADANTGDQATAAAGAAAAADAAAGAEGDELTPAEIEAAATALLELSWQKLGPELDKGGIPTAVAQRALDIELTKPEADQKLTIVKKLRASLGVE